MLWVCYVLWLAVSEQHQRQHGRPVFARCDPPPHLPLPRCPRLQVQEKLKQYKGQPFTMQTMAVIKNMVEGW